MTSPPGAPALMTARLETLRRGAAICGRAAVATVALIGTLHLLLGVELPFAAELEHAAFRAVLWLSGELFWTSWSWKMPLLVLPALAWRFTRPVGLAALSVPAVAAQLTLIVYGCLMARGLAAAGIVAAAVGLLLHRRAPAPEARPGLTAALTITSSIAGAWAVFAIIYNLPMQDPIFDLALLTGERGAIALYYFATLGLVAVALRGATRRSLLPAVAGAAALALVHEGDALLPALAGLVAATLFADHLRRAAIPLLPGLELAPSRFPPSLVFLCGLSLLCLLYGLAFRFTPCPEPAPGLERVADGPDEIFELATDGRGDELLVVYRKRHELRRVDLGSGTITTVDPGAFADPAAPGRLGGEPEVVTAVPERGGWVVSYTPTDAERAHLQYEKLGSWEDALLWVDASGSGAVRALPFPEICPVGGMTWDGARGVLAVGCEFRGELVELDLETESVVRRGRFPQAGDFQSFLVHDDGLLAVSLYSGALLTEVDLKGWVPSRSTLVGGGNYALRHAEDEGLLLITRYYASRLEIRDAQTLESVASLDAGFGARPLALDPRRGLALTGSVYDGSVRVFDLRARRPLGRVALGGYIKGIAVDSSRGAAWVGSICGLHRIDLDGWRAE